jgi:hypothetical protein
MPTLRSELTVPYTLNTSHPLYAYIVDALAINAAGASETAVQSPFARVGTESGEGYRLDPAVGNTATGWSFPSATSISNLPALSVFMLFDYTVNTNSGEQALYAERPGTAQIFKLIIKNGNRVGWVSRNSTGGSLQNGPTLVYLVANDLIHPILFVKNGPALREMYTAQGKGTNTGNTSGSFNYAEPNLLVDPQDNLSSNRTSNILLNVTFNSALTQADYDALRADPWAIFNVGSGGADTTAPVITVPQSTYTITVGDSFTVPNGTATDNADATVSVAPTGTVDTNTAGVYTLYYNHTDAAGNVATQVTVTVTVEAAVVGGDIPGYSGYTLNFRKADLTKAVFSQVVLTDNFKIKSLFKMPSTNAYLCNGGGFDTGNVGYLSVVRVNTTQVLINTQFGGAGVSQSIELSSSTGYPLPGEWCYFELERIGGTYYLKLNEATYSVATTSGAGFAINAIGRYDVSTAYDDYDLDEEMAYFIIESTSINRNFDSTASTGSDTVWVDTVAGNNATLVNFGSNTWVDHTSSAELVTATLSIQASFTQRMQQSISFQSAFKTLIQNSLPVSSGLLQRMQADKAVSVSVRQREQSTVSVQTAFKKRLQASFLLSSDYKQRAQNQINVTSSLLQKVQKQVDVTTGFRQLVNNVVSVSTSFKQKVVSAANMQVSFMQRVSKALNIVTEFLEEGATATVSKILFIASGFKQRTVRSLDLQASLKQRVSQSIFVSTSFKYRINGQLVVSASYKQQVTTTLGIDTLLLQQVITALNVTTDFDGIKPSLPPGTNFRLSVKQQSFSLSISQPSFKLTIRG